MAAQSISSDPDRCAACVFLSRQLGTLVLVDHKGGRIDPATANTCLAAKAIGLDVTALISGDGPGLDAVAKDASETLAGVSKVIRLTGCPVC